MVGISKADAITNRTPTLKGTEVVVSLFAFYSDVPSSNTIVDDNFSEKNENNKKPVVTLVRTFGQKPIHEPLNSLEGTSLRGARSTQVVSCSAYKKQKY